MPWWVYLYLLGFGVVTFFWVRQDIRDGGSKPLLAAELASDTCMVLTGLGYWLLPIRVLLGDTAPQVFVAGLAWLFIAGVRDVRATWPSKDTAFVKVGTALFAVGLYLLVCGPLLYWGFSYAILGRSSAF